MGLEYDVAKPTMVAGRRRDPGDVVAHETIMRSAPWQLGSLLRRGNLVPREPAPVEAAPDFDGMTKAKLKAFAKEHNLDVPAGLSVADLRDWMKENYGS